MKQRIIIINGPNLNLLGKREESQYGDVSYSDLEKKCAEYANNKDIKLTFKQSNIEGELIDKIQDVGFSYDGIILNAAAYTHTSVGIGDAVKGITTPVVELHISNVHAREEFRHHSYIASAAKGVLFGFGLKGYELAIQSFL